MAVPSIISPRQRWMNPDGTPDREFYKLVALLPGVNAVPPTVTGSRGGNVALASLLTALAGIGVIVDGTTP